MKRENWKKVKELLDEVLQLEQSERKRFLSSRTITPEIRSEVESLLAFDNESEEMMNLSAVEFSNDFFDEEDDANAIYGQTFGVYRVVKELGYGGMGAVYLAERSDGKFDQKVALKLLKREMNTSALRRRFRQEREILASLEHPNIARLLDAGTTDDKIPYIAMEYVEGLPINDFCNKQNLDLDERLDLFRQVCAAVDFAHRNLIVHRDLKPSNILVNDDGIPKLLDFGISKIISTELEQLDSATVTRFGMMTPSYASPEQLQSKSVTTATDIYSLGIILYELLSGHRPFETKEQDFKEIHEAITDADPPLPSSWNTGFSGETKDVANRFVIKTNLHLKGDLDNIILKAIKKEPENRYSSAENFAADIKRHQDGLPVTARAATFSYRAGKFIKRNKVSVGAGAIVLPAIVGGIVSTLWQTRVAKAEAAKSAKINDFLQNILNFSNPHWLSSNPNRNKEAKISEALDEALKNIDTDLSDTPEVQAEVLFTIGKTYLGRGEFEQSEEILKRAKSLFIQVNNGENTKSIEASVMLGDNLFAQGKYEEAEKNYKYAINYFRPRVSESKDHLKYLAIALTNLGQVYYEYGKYDLTAKLNLESLKLAEKLEGRNRQLIPIVIQNLGKARFARGDYKGALKYLHQSLAEIRSSRNERTLEGSETHLYLGENYLALRQNELAEKHFQIAYDISKSLFGEKQLFTINAKLQLAILLYFQKKYRECENLAIENLRISIDNLPEGHLTIFLTRVIVGRAYTRQGKLKEGEQELRKALEGITKLPKKLGSDLAYAQGCLADNLITQKRLAEARELLESAVEGYFETHGKDNNNTRGAIALLKLTDKRNGESEIY